jgi:hypothetical protein
MQKAGHMPQRKTESNAIHKKGALSCLFSQQKRFTKQTIYFQPQMVMMTILEDLVHTNATSSSHIS